MPEHECGPNCTQHASHEADDSLDGFQEARRKFIRDSLITGGAAASIGALGITMTPSAHAADSQPGSPPWMYIPAAFREDRLEVLHALIASHSLATLLTYGSNGLLASLIPFTLTANEKLVCFVPTWPKRTISLPLSAREARLWSSSKALKPTSPRPGMPPKKNMAALRRRGTTR